VKHRERRPPRFDIDWPWIAFLVLYVGVGAVILLGVLYLLEGR